MVGCRMPTGIHPGAQTCWTVNLRFDPSGIAIKGRGCAGVRGVGRLTRITAHDQRNGQAYTDHVREDRKESG
jgi:hypothetical protein